MKTAWVEGVEGFGWGEKIKIRFKMKKGIKSIPFKGFDILNGYVKNENVWKDNARVKLLVIFHNKTPLFNLKLINTMKPQYIQLDNEDHVQLKNGDTITLEIMNTYHGRMYRDTAISEIHFH